MDRRRFLAAAAAASTAAIAGKVQAQTAPAREFYQIRRYQLRTGPQLALTQSYFSESLIPALVRMGIGPVGAFQLAYGPETPTYYLLIPGPSATALAELDLTLSRDPDFLKSSAPFWNATATAPAFERVESWLLSAFEGWPKLTPPPATEKTFFQLRAYCRAPATAITYAGVEMFIPGESKSSQAMALPPFRRFADWLPHALPEIYAQLRRPG